MNIHKNINKNIQAYPKNTKNINKNITNIFI